MKKPRRHHVAFHRSSSGRVAFATAVALLAGAGTALFLVVGAGLAGARVPGAWLAASVPIASAMVAAAATAAFLHWRKVGSRAAVYGAILTMALLILLAGQLVRFAEVAALVQGGGFDALLSTDTWRAAVDLTALSPARLDRTAPVLVAVSDVVGRDRLWVFAALELSLVAGLAWWMAGRTLSAPLCEVCRAWCVRERGVAECAADAAAPEVVRQRAAARDWRFFRELGPARGRRSLRFDLSRCPRCSRSTAVSVMVRRPLRRDRCLIGDLRLGSDDVRTILDLVDAQPKAHPA